MDKESMLGKIVKLVMMVPDQFLGTLVDLLEKLSGQDAGEWSKELKKFLRKEECWGKERAKVVQPKRYPSPYPRLLTPEPLTLTPTDGSQAIAKASKLFTGYLDPDFENWGTNVSSQPTKETKVEVHELIKDGRFADIFSGLSTNLDNLCLTQPQIIQFVEKHKQWLRADGYGTFFLFKANGEFFVALVDVCSAGRLIVLVGRFVNVDVWSAGGRGRFVLPQLIA
jgi:hypothetical protein